jgi:hypothetical protein
MAAVIGKLAKVMYGSVKIAGLSTWTVSGYEAQTLEDTEFGDSVQSFLFGGAGDPGTISFTGYHDPADTTGQAAFATACKAGVELSNLYFYETATKYWAVAAGGKILPTKCDSISFDRNALGQVDFAGKVSGAVLTAYGT